MEKVLKSGSDKGTFSHGKKEPRGVNLAGTWLLHESWGMCQPSKIR